MEKFTMKRPIKADYVRKYGFEGERIWRFDLLKYNEAKDAYERRERNIREYQRRVRQ